MKYFATKLSDNINITPEGFLLCVGISIARTGEQEYLENETPLKAKDGKVIISRSEDEVFDPKTIASFEGKCFTIRHPPEFVNTENFKKYSVGHVQNVRRGDGEQKNDLVADVLIKDGKAISLVKDGMRELSCGYEAEYVQTEDGRGEQKNIRGNHLALVDEGRAGPQYAIKDEKGNSLMKLTKDLAEKMKKIFVQTLDESVEEKDAKKDDEGKEVKSKDAEMYDSFAKKMEDFLAQIKDMLKPDAAKDADGEEKEEPAKDADAPAPSVEERLKALEEKLAKVLEAESAESSVLTDEDPEAEEEDEKAEEELVGDEKAKAEILAPGKKFTKDSKVECLKVAYATADGKKVIDGLTGGKMNFKDSKMVDLCFNAASEMLKPSRNELGKHAAKRVTDYQSSIFNHGPKTAADINKANEDFYKNK